jgi:hypothetical protein
LSEHQSRRSPFRYDFEDLVRAGEARWQRYRVSFVDGPNIGGIHEDDHWDAPFGDSHLDDNTGPSHTDEHFDFGHLDEHFDSNASQPIADPGELQRLRAAIGQLQRRLINVEGAIIALTARRGTG